MFSPTSVTPVTAPKKKDDTLDPDKLLAHKNYLSPKETLYVIVNNGVIKTTYPPQKIIVMGIIAGIYVGIAATVSLVVATGSPELRATNPGLQKLAFGAVFPVGLISIVIAGGELFTGNVMTLLPPVLMGKISVWKLLLNWFLVYFSNFAGCLLAAYFLAYLPEIFHVNPYHGLFLRLAESKIEYSFHVIFLRGIGCNLLICVATYMATAALDTTGKITGMFLPAMTFATIGYEHCIANMFMISLAMMEGADISVGEFIGSSVIPATLGNIVGGGLLVGVASWYIHTNVFFWWNKHPHREDHHSALYDDKKLFDPHHYQAAIDILHRNRPIFVPPVDANFNAGQDPVNPTLTSPYLAHADAV
eukprot:TRINITY_DN9181_c0_g1_i5.p1 TRINITY_DN9181_c0_g1~~TRINITY_DN9181_c0_g1_i5.p1  ORF type:complete len:362 (+),score=65.45 TRINITY_DN9181_c0_g1_i5:49-1134(+)